MLDVDEVAREIRKELKACDMSLIEFSDKYVDAITEGKACYEEKEKHYKKFSKQMNSPPKCNKTNLYGCLYFLKNEIKKDDLYSREVRHAAWELSVQLNTRIATRPLADDHGKEESALESCRRLFREDRTIRTTSGPLATKYMALVDEYFDKYLRPFTARWHRNLNNDTKESFRRELITLQGAMRELCTSLEQMARP